jgi:hypothetical protein
VLLINDPSNLEVTASFDGQGAVFVLPWKVESLVAIDLWAALAGWQHERATEPQPDG